MDTCSTHRFSVISRYINARNSSTSEMPRAKASGVTRDSKISSFVVVVSCEPKEVNRNQTQNLYFGTTRKLTLMNDVLIH